MFEAYKVGIRLSLVSNVATGLAMMSRQFASTGAQAKALQVQLKGIQALAMTGGIITGAGLFGLKMMGDALEPAKEYAHQLNVINMAGLTHIEQVQAIGDAWKNTHTVITTTATDNLKTLLDLRNVLTEDRHGNSAGTMDLARNMLPVVSRIQAVLAASTEGKISGNSQDLAFSMAKALDIANAASKSPAVFEQQALMMAKVITAFQGRVTPDQYKSVFTYARQALPGLSDEFKYELLPTLLLEMGGGKGGGGGSRGVGPMLSAFYRFTNQGFVNKKSLPLLEQLGLIKPGSGLGTSTTGSMVSAMTGHELAAANPFAWVQQVLLPAIHKKYGASLSDAKLQEVIGEVFRGNQLAAFAAMQYALKPGNFLRDQSIIRGAMAIPDAYKAALSNDPGTAQKALDAQWTNLKVSLMMGVVPLLVPLLTQLANVFMAIGDAMRDHPMITQALAVGMTGLFAAMGLVIGPLLLIKASVGAFSLALPNLAAGLAGTTGALGVLGTALTWLKGGLIALAAGYAVGTLINYCISAVIEAMTGGKDSSLGTWLYDVAHPHQYDPKTKAQSYKNGLGLTDADGNPVNQPTGVAPRARTGTVLINTNLKIDGRTMAKMVSEHQVKMMVHFPSTGSQGLRSDDAFTGPDMPGGGLVSP